MKELNIEALKESGELILRLRNSMLEVNRLGFAMFAALSGHQFQSVPDIVKRMEVASAEVVVAAQNFHASVARAANGAKS